MDKEKTTYVLKKIYSIQKIFGRIIETEKEEAIFPFERAGEQDPVVCSPQLYQSILDCCSNKERYVCYGDEGYLYYALQKEKFAFIWGPFVYEEKSAYQKRRYLEKRSVKEKEIYIPLIKAEKAEEVIRFAHGLITEEYKEEITFHKVSDNLKILNQLHEDYAEYNLESSENGFEHYSFQLEEAMWKGIIKGDIDIESGSISGNDDVSALMRLREGRGVMAHSLRKDKEYGMVAMITLATRYGISLGIKDTDAYALSDTFLQRLAQENDVSKMEFIGRSFIKELQKLKYPEKNKSPKPLYIEQSKEYIAKHIYEKLSLQTIAEAVGIHPAYLSSMFSKYENMTIMEYALKEKIEVSCNLLKYSNRSIAIIAEYMNLSPQSYFTKVFKKVTGETPAQYRKNHIPKEFLSS